jgi:hypothetical protein
MRLKEHFWTFPNCLRVFRSIKSFIVEFTKRFLWGCLVGSSSARFFLIRSVGGGVQLGPLGTEATDWPIVACPGWLWWWSIWWMKIGKGNRSTRRNPAPAPPCPPQIPLDQTQDRTQAAAVGSQRLTAWAMAQPSSERKFSLDIQTLIRKALSKRVIYCG